MQLKLIANRCRKFELNVIVLLARPDRKHGITNFILTG